MTLHVLLEVKGITTVIIISSIIQNESEIKTLKIPTFTNRLYSFNAYKLNFISYLFVLCIQIKFIDFTDFMHTN